MAKNMIIQVLIDGVTYEAMVKTTGEMVWLTDDVTVSAKIAEIVKVLNLKATTAYVDEQIAALGTPEDGDDGGYYLIEISQTDEQVATGTMTVSYIASKDGMETVKAQTVQLPAGKNGTSPTVSVDPIDGGHRITIIDAEKSTSFDVMDGGDGDDGVGIASVKQTETSSEDGGNNVLTVTLTNGTTATFTVKNGSKGDPGVGVKSVVQTTTSTEDSGSNIVTVTMTDGSTATFTVKNGSKGGTGATPQISAGTVTTLAAGSNATASIGGTAEKPVINFGIPRGATGATPQLSIGTVTTLAAGSNATASIGGTAAAPTLSLGIPHGAAGSPGYTPVRGTDYWTEADKAEIVAAVIESLGGEPILGHVDENNNIIVSGDLPDGTYSVKYEMEDGSTLNIGNLVLGSVVYYTVTNNLTNCTTSISETKIAEGGSYSATITANSGYELKSVTVTMSGSPVTVSGGTISIANVTGDIVITAVAEEVQTSGYTNLANPDDAYWKEDYRISISSGSTQACEGRVSTNFIPAKRDDVLRVKGMSITTRANSQDGKVVFYSAKDNESSKLGGMYGVVDTTTTYTNYGSKVTVDGDISTYTLAYDNKGNQVQVDFSYIRLDGVLLDGYTAEDVIITINEEITDDGTTYTNMLPLAVDTDGSPYNGGKGYKSGYKMSGSTGGESATDGAYCSGFIPVEDLYDEIYITNITLHSGANVNNILFYDASKTMVYKATGGTAGAFTSLVSVDGDVYHFSPSTFTNASVSFFRFSCGGITDETIVTINEKIA